MSGPREVIILTHMLSRYLDDFGNVVRYLDNDGCRVIIYACGPRDFGRFTTDSEEYAQLYRDRLPSGVELRTLPFVRSGSVSLGQLLELVSIGIRLARRHPDAVFLLWSVYLIVACGLPLRLYNRRCVFMVTGLGTLLGSTARRLTVLRAVAFGIYAFLMSGRNSRCLNHNEEDKAVLVRRTRASRSKFFVTPGCGVDPLVFPYVDERPSNDPPVVLVPTRLVKQKGVAEAVAASGRLRDRGVRHEMRFTGGREPHPYVRVTDEDIDRFERENPCVRFLGFQPSMPPVFADADVVCYPTRYPEGTPTGLIEAAASGRPAVTCDTVGAREIVIDGVTGFVVPQLDVVALADALQVLLSDAALYERMRRAAYQHFLAHYTKDAALVATLATLESLGCRFDMPKTAPDIRVV